MPGLEVRPSQIAMCDAVASVLEGGGRLMVEAGPGTGKTFAYLAPALLQGRSPNERLVIATWTKNLQEQLIEKDLPFLQKALGTEVNYALVQGRENYVCRRRLDQALLQALPGTGLASHRRQLDALAEWARHSGTGIRSHFGVEPAAEVWNRVKAERGNCLNQHSPYFAQCGWQWAKRNARSASILVVNHALLMADLRMRQQGTTVLPPYQALIIDEAHHLEEVAADNLGVRVSRASVLGTLTYLEKELLLEEAEDSLRGLARLCQDRAEELLAALESWLGKELSKRIRRPLEDPCGFQDSAQTLIQALRRWADTAHKEAEQTERNKHADRVAELALAIDEVMSGDHAERVAWIERGDKGQYWELRTAWIDPAPVLAKELFEPLHSVTLTSATLTTPKSSFGTDGFEYLRASTGIGAAEGIALPSPFNFQEQARIRIEMLPEPSRAEAYQQSLIEAIPRLVICNEGRSFVLFTSRRLMHQVAQAVRDELADEGILTLVQGAGMSRRRLLQEFCSNQPAALFGVSSFWEGVDVPGPELTQVILTRLPFAMPDRPRDQAKAERIQAAGKSSFQEQSLPEAVLRWKQGFGRLIRTAEDRGVVTILDSRVLTKPYGRWFLQALPACPRYVRRGDEEFPLSEEELG